MLRSIDIVLSIILRGDETNENCLAFLTNQSSEFFQEVFTNVECSTLAKHIFKCAFANDRFFDKLRIVIKEFPPACFRDIAESLLLVYDLIEPEISESDAIKFFYLLYASNLFDYLLKLELQQERTNNLFNELEFSICTINLVCKLASVLLKYKNDNSSMEKLIRIFIQTMEIFMQALATANVVCLHNVHTKNKIFILLQSICNLLSPEKKIEMNESFKIMALLFFIDQLKRAENDIIFSRIISCLESGFFKLPDGWLFTQLEGFEKDINSCENENCKIFFGHFFGKLKPREKSIHNIC